MGIAKLLERQDNPALSFTNWARLFRPGGQVVVNGQKLQAYQVGGGSWSPGASYYDTNSVVFACTATRMLLFSEARFQFQRLRNGRPGDLFGAQGLGLLERPWANGTSRDLLKIMELDATQFGNSYWVVEDGQMVRLDPMKVTILTAAVVDATITGQTIGQRLAGYGYEVDDRTQVVFPADQVGHYAPYPDRDNRFRGMSWLSPCLPDIDADEQFTEHKRSVLRNGSSLTTIVSVDPMVTEEQFQKTVDSYRAQHEGPANAGRTLFISGGTDVKTASQTFEQLAVKATQGAGETRIAACSGVPPVIVGLSEGLSSATYSNYGQARRRLVDGTMRPLWGAAAGSLENLVAPPTDARLWYDDRDIPFLREDVMDQAEILSRQALTIESLIRGGFKPDSARDAVIANDYSLLEHTGLFSVQLQPPQPDGPVTPSPVTP